MSNLRQAAQQALEALSYNDMVKQCLAITVLQAALAESEQEPVGHADLGINNIYIFSESEPRVVPAGRTPLYTAPTPRKPLTDEEMRKCAQAMNAEPLAEGWPELIKFARAIERAHGITGETNV